MFFAPPLNKMDRFASVLLITLMCDLSFDTTNFLLLKILVGTIGPIFPAVLSQICFILHAINLLSE